MNVSRKMTDAADSRENTMKEKITDNQAISEAKPKPNPNMTTREDAIEAFRRILLGEPGIGGNA